MMEKPSFSVTIDRGQTLLNSIISNSKFQYSSFRDLYVKILLPELKLLKDALGINYISVSFLIDINNPDLLKCELSIDTESKNELIWFFLNYDEYGPAAKICINKNDYNRLSKNDITHLGVAILTRFQIFRLLCTDFNLTKLFISEKFFENFNKIISDSFLAVGSILWEYNKNGKEILSLNIHGFDEDMGQEYRLPVNKGIIGTHYKKKGIVIVRDLSNAIHKQIITDYNIQEIVIKTIENPSGGIFIISLYLRRNYKFTNLDCSLLELFIQRFVDYIKYNNILSQAQELIENTKKHAILINHGLMAVLQVHDLKECITELNSYKSSIEQYARRGKNEIEGKVIDAFFENLNLLDVISKQLTRNASISKPRKRCISLVDLMIDISELRKKEMSDRDRPINIELRLKEFRGKSCDIKISRLIAEENIICDIHEKEILNGFLRFKINVDQWQLRRYFANLIENAIYWTNARSELEKSKEKKIITISLEIYLKEIVIGIHDQGTGVNPSILDKMFEIFESKKPNGMGFGLYVCKLIADVNNYKLSCYKNRDGGASFITHINYDRR